MQFKISKDKISFLEQKALSLRIDSIRATTASKSGHPTSCLSAADMVSVLFFDLMHFDIEDPFSDSNDRFIISKGHAVPLIYAAWKQLGVISDQELLSLRKFDSPLEGHPTSRFIYNEAATGSLGQGLSVGAGIAINAKLKDLSYKTYVLLGDGEMAEGSIWEAIEFSAYYKLSNLIAFVDVNKYGQSEETMLDHHMALYEQKFAAFGWKTFLVDGHDIVQIFVAAHEAKNIKDRPSVILAKTFKGHGISAIEDKNGFHGKPLKEDEAGAAIDELIEKYGPLQNTKVLGGSYEKIKNRIPKRIYPKVKTDLSSDPNKKFFLKGEKIATRKAFGYALSGLGKNSNDVVVLDADVKNSTYTEIFEKDFPARFIECFIAEQNMVGVATGLQTRGNIPFAATFSTFYSRAFDQIRMAGIGRNALRLCGSHCGVSIGEDGPSQMGLEDIAMFRTIPNSIVLYPSDGVCTYKLSELAANYNEGISYIRTTRAETPILYDLDEEFKIGGCKVLREGENDQVCIVGAGITLYEALKAHEELKKENINTSLLDLYSVKPLDAKTLKSMAKKSQNRLLVVEDHYQAGGIGEAVIAELCNDGIEIVSLFVKDVPRSGTPAELLSWAGIDSDKIILTIKKMIQAGQ